MVSLPVPDPDFGGGRIGRGGGVKRVLVADDERHYVRLVQVNLERQGYEVITAADGREALTKAETEQPDMVLLDVMMPGLDGFEVLQALKQNPNTRDIPVFMLTVRAQDADVFRCWQSGVDGVLPKPFHPTELFDMIRGWFRK